MARAGKMLKSRKKWTDKENATLMRTAHWKLEEVKNLLPSRSLSSIASQRWRLKATNKRKFTQEEEDFLEEVAGVMPLRQITKTLNRKTGIKRSLIAVKAKMTRLGLNIKLEWDNLPIDRWRILLNLTKKDFINWRKRGELIPKKVGRLNIVSIEQMMELINKYPGAFANSDEQLLLCYFGEEIYHKIIELKKGGLKRIRRNNKPIRIKCTKTGLTFNSLSDASKYFKVNKSTISRQLKRGEFIKL